MKFAIYFYKQKYFKIKSGVLQILGVAEMTNSINTRQEIRHDERL
jgi:hypothetical protein